MTKDELYMQRCIQLAKLGAGNVAPNPMVGAVLVYKDKIIGEGYHQKYGEAHAEVNCIASVKDSDRQFIEQSTLYVSLEPCTHFGKTPPCSDLIIRHKIPRVVIGSYDPFKEVDGRGIKKLKTAGIEVITGVLQEACEILNKRFFTFHTKLRPYIILKWAQTANKKIAINDNKRLIISGNIANRLVHKWRSKEAAILVGARTVTVDDPSLTNRLWAGKNPIRLLVDKTLKFPKSLKVFDDSAPTIVFNYEKQTIDLDTADGFINQVYYFKIEQNESLVQQIAHACYSLNIQSILVEGGAQLLQSFIDEKLLDEARIISNTNMIVDEGLEAPLFGDFLNTSDSFMLGKDIINIFL